MGGLSPIHILILLVVVVLLLGKGKVSGLMGDIAQGIKSFKKNMADDPPHDAAMTVPPAKLAQDQAMAQRAPVQPAPQPQVRDTVPPA